MRLLLAGIVIGLLPLALTAKAEVKGFRYVAPDNSFSFMMPQLYNLKKEEIKDGELSVNLVWYPAATIYGLDSYLYMNWFLLDAPVKQDQLAVVSKNVIDASK